MAKITLCQVWVNLMATGQAVHAYSSDRSRGRAVEGQVRKYAAGRMRPVVSEGVRGTFSFKLRDVSGGDVATLESWFGLPVCVRDYRGRVFFGVYFELSESERRTRDLYDITINLQEITYQLGVL
jgi:hypothetical protein